MAKAGMRRPDPGDPKNHGAENRQRPHFEKNNGKPVTEIQGKANMGNKKVNPT